jgi:hypothetical protein
MKKIRRDKPIGIRTHIYIEISQGNFWCSYLYLKQAKMPCFSFYLFSFIFYKNGEQEGKISPAQRGSLAPVGGGRYWGNEVGG